MRRPPSSTRADTLFPYSTPFRSYRGYTHSSCISINHVVCHGIPSSKTLKKGDIVNEIGSAHVRTPITNAHLVCRLLLDKKIALTGVQSTRLPHEPEINAEVEKQATAAQQTYVHHRNKRRNT